MAVREGRSPLLLAGFEDGEGPMNQGIKVTCKLEEAWKWVLPQNLQKEPRPADSLLFAP